LIWTDQGRRNGIHAAIKTTGEKIRGLVHPHIGVSFDIIVFDVSHQPLVSGTFYMVLYIIPLISDTLDIMLYIILLIL